MSEIAFKEWVDYSDERQDAPIGGLGGWFNSNLVHDEENPTNHTWEDYINNYEDASKPYLVALKEEVLKHGLKITGDRHQHAGGAPLFSDGTVGRFSYRAWGDFMAAVYTTEEHPLSYMAYYM